MELEWQHFIGRVVTVRTFGGGGGEGGEGGQDSERECTGMLCAVEPGSGYVLLLRLGLPAVEKEEGVSGIAGGGQHGLTLLHPHSIDAIELLDPVPGAWREFLMSGVAANQTANDVESVAAVDRSEAPGDRVGVDDHARPLAAKKESTQTRPTLEDTVGLLRKNRLHYEVVPEPRTDASKATDGRIAAGTILMFGGELEIRGPPYDDAHCVSTNAVMLRRMRKLLSSQSFS